MAFIRPFSSPQDEDAILHIFRETAASDLRSAGNPALHTASLIWARPYLFISGPYCFVLDDGTGRAVGYVLGVPSTEKFVASYRSRYLPYLEREDLLKDDLTGSSSVKGEGDDGDGGDGGELSIHAVMRGIVRRPELMLNVEVPELLGGYPAHLHIGILDEWQRRGWGKGLIQALCDRLRGEGVVGVHLGMVGTNHGAVMFYESLGFRRFDLVMDGGVSGEVGRAGDGGLWMVKKLDVPG